MVRVNELRAVGLRFNRVGDITENDLLREMGLPLRVTYFDNERLRLCGGAAPTPQCN